MEFVNKKGDGGFFILDSLWLEYPIKTQRELTKTFMKKGYKPKYNYYNETDRNKIHKSFIKTINQVLETKKQTKLK